MKKLIVDDKIVLIPMTSQLYHIDMKKLYSRSYDVRNTLHLYARDRSKRF